MMRSHAVRILAVAAAVSVPVTVALIACNPELNLPGLANELPNRTNGGGVGVQGTGTGGSGGAVGTGGAGGSGGSGGSPSADAGPAESLCDCAAAVNAGGACETCSMSFCGQSLAGCQMAAANECATAIECVASCAPGNGACLSACINVAPDYATYLNCLFGACTSSCGWSPPTTCTATLDGG